MTETVFDQCAGRLRDFLSDLEGQARDGERVLAERAGVVLGDYEDRLRSAGAPAPSVSPARYAYAVLIDQAVRTLPGISTSAWLAGAHVHVFDGRDITIDTLRRFLETARSEGREFLDLAEFLEDVIGRLEGKRRTREGVSRKPTLLLALGFLGFAVCLGAYVLFLDYRYHAGVMGAFHAELAEAPATPASARLDHIGRIHGEVSRASAAAPLSRLVELPFWRSGPSAEAIYRQEVASALPDAIRAQIGRALSVEGEDIAIYDTLRAWAILSGRTEWSPAYLAGWLKARNASLGSGVLAPHVAFLSGPEPRLAVPDGALLEQAEEYARTATESDRAFLELTRLPEAQALGQWDATAAVPDLAEVFVLRSGRSLQDGIPQIFGRDGWDFARRGGIETAIRVARREAARLFVKPVETRRDTGDLVLAKLQDRSLSIWKDWLHDLRVRPFTDRRSAVRVSGMLSRRNSPLEALFLNVWREAGGEDGTRPVAAKRKIDETFGETVNYIRTGGVESLSSLFGSLNIALSTIQRDDMQGADKLMNLQERARSVVALRNAPPLVTQIAEDVLAQSSAAHASLLTNPLTREWQARVYPLCQRAVEGRYPFHGEGSSDLDSFTAFFGQDGALPRFLGRHAARYLDTEAEVWRWSPEARLSGVNQDSAEFLQRVVTISSAFFGEDPAFGARFKIAALAEKGEATVHLGGAMISMRSTGDGTTMEWPGAAPRDGMEVAFREGGSTVRITEPGLWGFLKLLDQTSIRRRDDGRRHLVDLRVSGGRLFFELKFDKPLNPVSAKPLLKDITCPPVL